MSEVNPELFQAAPHLRAALGRLFEPQGSVLLPQNRNDKPGGHDQPGKDEEPPPYQPRIVCRTYVGDQGVRPLAPGVASWEAEDIWVTAPDGTSAPVAGKVNQVHVHVWNMGNAPAYGVTVELYWCDPTVGVSLAGATLIGVQNIALQAGEDRVLDFPWTPVVVNGGHECLVAHAFDPVSDNIVAPFNAVLDRHVAQQNVNLIILPAGKTLQLNFVVPNFSAQAAHSTLHVQELRGPDLQQLAPVLGRAFIAPARGARAALGDVKFSAAQPTLNLKEHPAAATFRETLNPAPSCFRGNLMRGALTVLQMQADQGEEQRDDHAPATEWHKTEVGRRFPGELHLEAQTQASVTLTVQAPEHAAPGSAFAYRIVESVDGVVTGGITYLIQVAAPRKR